MAERWSPVDVGDAVVVGLTAGEYGQAVAFGAAGGRPVALLVGEGGRVQDTVRPVGTGPVTSVSYAESYTMVVGRSYPLLVVEDFPTTARGAPSAHRVEDQSTVGAVRLFAVCASEDPVVVTVRADGWVVAAEDGDPTPRETGPGLRLTADVEEARLLVGEYGDMGLLVAGDVEGGDGSTAPLWCLDFYQGWVPVALGGGAPDALTDVEQSFFACVAGHRDLGPVVYDSNDHFSACPVPDVRLDPSHPVVLLFQGATHLAVQSEDGPQAWTRVDGTWTADPLPPGRLEAACRGRSRSGEDRLFVVIDGQVWQRPTVA